MNIKFFTFITIILVFFLVSGPGCGGSGGKQESAQQSSVSGSGTPWKIYDAPPGADPSVPPDQGGAGFEKMAAGLGYQTYELSKDELKFFGDPRAKKGGMIIHITPRFLASFRVEGKDSNYAENSQILGALCYQGLLTMHPVTMEWMPSLASHWKISDDKMTFWYRINPEARFWDGKPVTSADVIATWKLNMDEGILAPSNQLVFGKFEEPVAESKYIVRVKSKTLNWRNFLYFSGGAAMPIMPAHHLDNVSGAEFLKKYQFDMIPGTGPYIVLKKDIKKQQSFTLTRRPDFWAKDYPQNRYLYNFDKIKCIVVKDNQRLEFEKCKAGDQDFYVFSTAEWWVNLTDFESIQKGWMQKRRIWNDDPQGMYGYHFNMREKPFDDIRVRKAMVHLHNRENLNEKFFFNQYELMDSCYPGSIYENPDNPIYRYDPELAIKLLREAGWKDKNGQGILIKNGMPFSFDLAIYKSPTMERIITNYQQELRKVGIDMQIKFLDRNTIFKMSQERKFKLHFQAWTGLIFPNPETSWHSSLADKSDNNNITGMKNKRIDEICEIYDKTFDQKKRVELIQEVDKILMDNVPVALAWYGPYKRIIYWNRFGHPDYYLTRYNDYYDIFSYWWYDADKDLKLKQAMKNGEQLPVGDVEVKYWPEFRKTERMKKSR